MSLLDRVIEIARSQKGYRETGDNITKYTADMDKINYYNGNKQGHDWCAEYTDWCIWQALNKNKSKALKINYEPTKDNCGASCYFQYVYYSSKKRFFKNPKVGDKVIFGTALAHKKIKHIGLVIEVNGKKFKTSEGNAGNAVKERNYTLGVSKNILGFLRPDYAKYDDTPAPTPAPSPDPVQPKTAPAQSFNKKYNKSYKTIVSCYLYAAPNKNAFLHIGKGTAVRCYGFYTGSYLYVTCGKYEGYININNVR